MTKEKSAIKAFKQKMDLFERFEKVRNGFEVDAHIGLTKLGRSPEWRQQLKALGAIQVTNRNKTVGVLLEPEVFNAMLNFISLIDEEMEQESFAAMVERRKGTTGFLSGDELTAKAIAVFEENQQRIRKFLDDDQ